MTYVTPVVTQEQAVLLLSVKKPFLPLRRLRKNLKIIKTELIFIPFFLFEIRLQDDQSSQLATLTLDGILGQNLFYLDNDIQTDRKTGHPVCPFLVAQHTAREQALDSYKWLQLEHSLRSKRNIRSREIVSQNDIFFPFWIGYFQRKVSYDFQVLDAVSGELQGVRMRKVILRALRALAARPSSAMETNG